jgi:iron complex outermembrane recepter protein
VFYYDYGDLQVSRIANNTSLNDNIDAEIYGLEIEGLWRPEQVPGLMIDFSYSYLKAETAGGASPSIRWIAPVATPTSFR